MMLTGLACPLITFVAWSKGHKRTNSLFDWLTHFVINRFKFVWVNIEVLLPMDIFCTLVQFYDLFTISIDQLGPSFMLFCKVLWKLGVNFVFYMKFWMNQLVSLIECKEQKFALDLKFDNWLDFCHDVSQSCFGNPKVLRRAGALV